MTPETALYEFLNAAALESTDQGDLAVHSTAYQNLESVKTLRIGNAETMFAPGVGVVKEYDCDLTLQILHRVEDSDNSDSFNEARDGATEVATWAVETIQLDDSLGGRQCGVNVYKAFRGWAKINTQPYAVVLIPIRVNPMSYE